MESHFPTAGPIDVEQGRAGKARVLLEQAKRLAVLAECGKEAGVLFPRELDDAQFRDHDGPAKDGSDRENEEDEFTRNRGVLECEEQTAGRNQLRNEHFRVT